MNRRLPAILLAVVLLGTCGALVVLYRLRMGQGDVFPEYSTLRADPLGLRGLHDSLADVPGVSVTRWLRPLDQLPAAPPRTLIMAGLTSEQWAHFTAEDFNALDAAVRGGCRLVVALRDPAVVRARRDPARPGRRPSPKPEEEKAPPGSYGRLPAADGDEKSGSRVAGMDVGKWWGVELKHRPFRGAVHRVASAPAELPHELPWNSDVYFVPAQGVEWTVLYRGPDPMLLERREGLGSIVLAGDAYFLSNEALQRNRAVSLLVEVVGREPRVEFIETHLGVAEHPGVGALARRYGLAPAFFALLAFAGLFVWRRMAVFVPPAPDAEAIVLDYHQTAGLEALLRRSVSSAELVPACMAEWRATARPADLARAETALAGLSARTAPAAAYNAIVRALRPKR